MRETFKISVGYARVFEDYECNYSYLYSLQKEILMTQGIHHLGLTVDSLEEAKDFFIDTLGWKVVKEDASYPSLFVSDGEVMITLWKAQTEEPLKFNRKTNLGIHHFAIKVSSSDELNSLFLKIKDSKFTIEFEPELIRNGPAEHFICHGPSQLRIEFINV
jgi:catechol 2,3-dioxygenase-like lactoylglutathione lyase family enzyme